MGVYLVLGGVPGPGGLYLVPGRCTWFRGISGPRGCIWSGGVPGPRSVPGQGGVPGLGAPSPGEWGCTCPGTPPCGQTPVKT